MVESIEFYEEDTGGPIDTITGGYMRWLVQHSGLIQLLLENDPTVRHLRVPVSMPTDRIQTFRKIIKGYPIGSYTKNGEVIIDPLGSKEEQAIEKNVKNRRFNSVQEARAYAIQDILQYLMIDIRDFDDILIYAPYSPPKNVNNNIYASNNEKEMKRRANVTRKRKAILFAQPNGYMTSNEVEKFYKNKNNAIKREGLVVPEYLNENAIEKYVEQHKNYLYEIHHGYKAGNEKLKKLLTVKNKEKRNKILANAREQLEKDTDARRAEYEKDEKELTAIINNLMKKQKGSYRSRALEEEIDYYDDQLHKLRNQYSDLFNGSNYNGLPFTSSGYNRTEPVINDPTQNFDNMSAMNFERYLRSKRGKEEREAPYRGSIVGNLFGPNNNL
jgi:hypothetical protein